jgi:CheY-specific phosphatase CheX
MISSRAQQAFQQMVGRAVQSSPLAASGRSCTLVPELDLARLNAEQVVVLTVASYAFRLNLLIHFSRDAKTYAHFAAVHRLAQEEMGEQTFVDAISECANICCGNLNRDLARHFPHLGMSTPNIIDRRCVAYLDQLGQGHQQHFAVHQPDGPVFAVSLCVNAFGPLDFEGDFAAAEATGELELF